MLFFFSEKSAAVSTDEEKLDSLNNALAPMSLEGIYYFYRHYIISIKEKGIVRNDVIIRFKLCNIHIYNLFDFLKQTPVPY